MFRSCVVAVHNQFWIASTRRNANSIEIPRGTKCRVALVTALPHSTASLCGDGIAPTFSTWISLESSPFIVLPSTKISIEGHGRFERSSPPLETSQDATSFDLKRSCAGTESCARHAIATDFFLRFRVGMRLQKDGRLDRSSDESPWRLMFLDDDDRCFFLVLLRRFARRRGVQV